MAGLIPQSFIDELLSRVDIVDVVDRRVSLKKAGKNYQACCPFHKEKTPSFSVQPEKQFFYCFGCGAGGNAVGFIMRFHNLGLPEAVEVVARDAGIEVPRERQSPGAAKRGAEQRALYDCLEQASKYFQQQLRRHPRRDRAVNWCKSRGLSGAVAREFQLGYAPPGWDNLLGALGADEAARGALLKAGLLVAHKEGSAATADKSPIYDRFRDRVVFPIRDSRGRTVAFGGRVLDDGKPKYLNSPETPVFAKGRELYGLFEARRTRADRLLLVEGYMDVIALAQAGMRFAVATLGTATSSWQIQRIFRQSTEVVFCFDGDEAGRRAAWRALETTLPLMSDGKRAKFLLLPEGEDPDSLVGKLGKQQFLERVAAAEPLETFFFQHLREGLDADSIEGRAALKSKAVPLLRVLPEGVYRQLMLDKLGEITGVDKQTLLMSAPARRRRAAESAGPPALADADYGPPPRPSEAWPGLPSRQWSGGGGGLNKPPGSELVAINFLQEDPKLALETDTELAPILEAGGATGKLLVELIEKVRENPDIDRYQLMEICYSTAAVRNQLMEVMTAEDIEPRGRDNIRREFLQILGELRERCSKKLADQRLRDQLQARTAAKRQ